MFKIIQRWNKSKENSLRFYTKVINISKPNNCRRFLFNSWRRKKPEWKNVKKFIKRSSCWKKMLLNFNFKLACFINKKCKCLVIRFYSTRWATELPILFIFYRPSQQLSGEVKSRFIHRPFGLACWWQCSVSIVNIFKICLIVFLLK